MEKAKKLSVAKNRKRKREIRCN